MKAVVIAIVLLGACKQSEKSAPASAPVEVKPAPKGGIDCAAVISPELAQKFFKGPLEVAVNDHITSCSYWDQKSNPGGVVFDCGPEPISEQLKDDILAMLEQMLEAKRVDFERGAVTTPVSFIFLDRDKPNCKVSINLPEPNPAVIDLAKHIASHLKP